VAVTTGGQQLDLLVGPAGAGKSTTMSAIGAVWESQHEPGSVIELAPSQKEEHPANQRLWDKVG
jgi:ABC-type uncharacterized transport system YnjBCD ATPase subunit